MSRRECKHGSACGHDLCPCDDPSGLILECDEFVDSGWRPKPREPKPKPSGRLLACVAGKKFVADTFAEGSK